jgi:hypothetical protein
VVYGQGDRLVAQVVEAVAAQGIAPRDLRVEQPNLEDVFLALTGRPMEETNGSEVSSEGGQP